MENLGARGWASGRRALGTLLVCLGAAPFAAAACGLNAGANGVPDGFAGGTLPIELPPAGPGLCSGDGNKKECSEPGGCSGSGSTGAGGSGHAPPGGGYGGGPGSGGYGTGGSSSFGGSSGSSGSGFGGSFAMDAGGGAAGSGPDAGACDSGVEGGAPDCDDAGTDAGMAALVLEPQSTTASCTGIDSQKPYTLHLSADDSNSTASPVIVRRLIRTGRVVPPSVVRPWEFLNYYDFSFEPAEPGEVRIVPQLSSCPENGELVFQVALQSEARVEERAALNVTFVLDTSGSMKDASLQPGGALPIELERAAVLAIAGRLQAGDTVSMVTWSTDQVELLHGHRVVGPNDATVVAAAKSIQAGGGTDLHAGLKRGYALAHAYYSADRINRVILISDGIANVGITDEQLIGRYADDEEGADGIYLSGIGVGDGINDTLMNIVTDAGRGAYVYLDSTEEADKMLGERFLQVVDLAARDVRLAVTLPWYMNVTKFYGEQLSADPAKVRPQHLGPNDAMLFFQVLTACDASLIHGDDRIRVQASWQTPFDRRQKTRIVDATLNDLAGEDARLAKGAAIASYAEALIASSRAPASAGVALERALDNVRRARAAKNDPDLAEVEELLTTYLDRNR